MSDVLVLIPSLDPDDKLEQYVTGLTEKGLDRIVVVNDGSRVNVDVFKRLEERGVTVLTHPVNKGKGSALKTGFRYILEQWKSTRICGVVTADADGQHSPEDTLKVAETLKESGNFVLGCRDFYTDNVPFKSRFGNRITTLVFQFLYGKRVTDTQTGLRGIPYDLLPMCMECEGERFEYEIRMLIRLVTDRVPMVEVPIETLYFESNRATHFSAVKDSARIYWVMFRRGFLYYGVSVLSFLLDILLFAGISNLFAGLGVAGSLLVGTICARIVSSAFNFIMNRNVVFGSDGKLGVTALRYYLLCAMQMFLSWALVTGIVLLLPFAKVPVKVVVDCLLSLLSYHVQNKWVFERKESGEK